MEAPITHESRREERQTKLSLFLGIFVWFLHQNSVYAISQVACHWGGGLTLTIGGLMVLQLVETVLTLIALVALLVLIYLPWREWRRFQSQQPPQNPNMLHDTEDDRRPLLAFITMLMNSLFLLFVLAAFLPIFALSPCGSA